jgi:DNA-binding NtrC family response regulator
MRLKVPWSELATLGVLYTAVAARSTGEPLDASTLTVLALALATALLPRLIARRAGTAADAMPPVLAATGLAAVALGTTVAGFRVHGAGLTAVRAACTGLAAGGALAIAGTLAATSARYRVRWLLAGGALAVALAGVLGSDLAATWGGLLPGTSLALLAIVTTTRHARSRWPAERARLVLPATGATLGTGALLLAGVLAPGEPATSRVLVAAGVLAAASGLALGAAGLWLDHAAIVARAAAAAAGASAIAGLVARAGGGALAVGSTGAVAALGLLAVGGQAQRRGASGRLVTACARALDSATPIERVEDLAVAVLEPLRSATGDLRAPASLWVLEGETRVSLDVAGAAQRGRLAVQAERALLAWLRARPHEVVFADALRPQQVRRPELRPVLASLDEHQAFAAVALLDGDEVAGAILVPRGARTALPTRGDERALRDLARRASGALATVLALERARARAEEARARAAQAEEARARAEAERDVARARARGGRGVRPLGSLEDTWVGYGEAMRALEARLAALAAGEGPVLLVAEPGTSVAAVVRRLHAASPRATGPCVLLDAAMVHPRDALATLVGDARAPEAQESGAGEHRPGWLELAGEGTLAIQDLPALGYEAHLALLDVLETGTARRLGESAGYPVRARIVVTTRGPLAAAGLPAELCALLAEATVVVPPLRERGEDLEALVLLGIDRACRVLNHAPVGITREALAALRAYSWPGNERELFEVLEHAVARTAGGRLMPGDLPVSVRAAAGSAEPRASVPPPESETYEALERRILEAALERAGGNKSEAARALGLARTTFLDKLRKFGLRD